MPTVSGFTTFGIIRKRMSDLYADFALRIKEGGLFGTQTTADAPDTFPTDPLVQIMATTSASLHELWEAVELYYAQLDRRTATGVYLEYLHGQGIARAVGQSDDDYRAILLNASARPTRTDIITVTTARPDIECAALVFSTAANPIDGIPVGAATVVVKGCNGNVDYNALATDIFTHVELGTHQLYGPREGYHQVPGGSCITYKFTDAQPVYAALELIGYTTSACIPVTGAIDIPAAAASILQMFMGSCGIGNPISAPNVVQALAALPGFVVTDVRMARRARQLWGNACVPADAPKVMICGVETPWVTSITCGPTAGETWCAPSERCITPHPWEFVTFDAQFITTSPDTTKGGCI